MVNLALAAAGGLPVRSNLPVPLQQPYAADPDTLTEWLVAKTENLGRDAVLAVLATMNDKYANVVDPLLTQERVDALLRELAVDVWRLKDWNPSLQLQRRKEERRRS